MADINGLEPIRTRETGATAVEFSLIATLLFLLLFGIVQFGLAYNRQQGLQAAAREGARLASLAGDVTETQVEERVRAAAPAFIGDPANDLDVTFDPATTWCTDLSVGKEVEVSVDIAPAAVGKYEVSLPVVGRFLPGLSASATFLCERERNP